MSDETGSDPDSPYWSIDIPGLGHQQALEVVELVRAARPGHSPVLVDPRFWLTLHLDRETVEVLRDALNAAGSGIVAASMTECFDEWLDWSARADPSQ